MKDVWDMGGLRGQLQSRREGPDGSLEVVSSAGRGEQTMLGPWARYGGQGRCLQGRSADSG